MLIRLERIVNLDRLWHELKEAELAGLVTTIAFGADPPITEVALRNEVTPTQAATIEQLVREHNAALLSPEQEAAQKATATLTAADKQVVSIPGWATWSEQRAIDYITANVTDLASAKRVLIAMARMLVALRNKSWPDLAGGQ